MAPMLIRVQTRLGQVCGCVLLFIYSHYVLAPTRRSIQSDCALAVYATCICPLPASL